MGSAVGAVKIHTVCSVVKEVLTAGAFLLE